MYSKAISAFIISAIIAMPIAAQNPTRPFPQELNYGGRTIKPNNTTQTQMNQDVIAKYTAYKNKYLKSTNANDGSGIRYWIDATGTQGSENANTISEAHGYGMIIFALMAGHEPQAKTIFDGMNRLRKAFRAYGNQNQNLMSWVVMNPATTPTSIPADHTAATDGDLDNAYALLLAYKQWSDNSYLTEAQAIINNIKLSEMHRALFRTALGSWDNGTNATRSSDWMPGHFRAFAEATGDNFWTQTADMVYTLLSQVSNNSTGLVPDFMKGNPPTADPQGGGTGESNAQHYSYNGCRVPWRIATDYAHHGTPAAKAQIDKISSWLRGATNGSPSNIWPGYQLNGTPLNTNYNDMAFTAPFASGMIANSDNQTFLNNTYLNIKNNSPKDEYAAAIQILNMLLISGNWWAPDVEGSGGGNPIIPDIELNDYVMAEWSDNGDDDYGSSATVTENDTENGTLRFQMNVAAANSENKIYPWASIGTYFEEGDFPADATKFKITYTSTAPLMITFEEPPVMVGGKEVEGYTRGFELPAASTEKTEEIYISGFNYPDWGEEYPTPSLNKSKISGIMIEAIPQEGKQLSINGKITEFKLLSGSATSISFGKTKNKQQKSAEISVSQRNINLNIASEKTVTLKISDVRGRLLYSKDVTLNSGVASLNIPNSISKNQILILNVLGKNGLNASQKILLK